MNSVMPIGKSGFEIGGILRMKAVVPKKDLDKLSFSGLIDMKFEELDSGLLLIEGARHNAFVNQGLQITLDRLFGLGTPPAAIGYMGITDDTNAVTATETLIDPGNNSNKTIVALVNKTRTAQTVSATATYSKANANFVIRKVALLNTSTDAGTGLINVIGGGGSAPYNEAFAIDLTGATSFNLTLGIDVLAQAS